MLRRLDAAAGGPRPLRPGFVPRVLGGFCPRTAARVLLAPLFGARSREGRGRSPGGRDCGALLSPRALSVPGFSPPDQARSVTRRFHPPLLLSPISFPPRSPALALSPPRLAEARPGTAGPSSDARFTQRAVAGRVRPPGTVRGADGARAHMRAPERSGLLPGSALSFCTRSGPCVFWLLGLAGCSALVRSAGSCPGSPGTALPRLLQPRAL